MVVAMFGACGGPPAKATLRGAGVYHIDHDAAAEALFNHVARKRGAATQARIEADPAAEDGRYFLARMFLRRRIRIDLQESGTFQVHGMSPTGSTASGVWGHDTDGVWLRPHAMPRVLIEMHAPHENEASLTLPAGALKKRMEVPLRFVRTRKPVIWDESVSVYRSRAWGVLLDAEVGTDGGFTLRTHITGRVNEPTWVIRVEGSIELEDVPGEVRMTRVEDSRGVLAGDAPPLTILGHGDDGLLLTWPKILERPVWVLPPEPLPAAEDSETEGVMPPASSRDSER